MNCPFCGKTIEIYTERCLSCGRSFDSEFIKKLRSEYEMDDFKLEIALGQKWLLIIGIVTMIFGIGFFLKYSIEQGWIPPEGRIALTYFWGLAFVIAGNFFRSRGMSAYGQLIVAAGSVVLYFATYAGFHIYHLFPAGLSYLLMAVTTALVTGLAVAYDSYGLALLGFLGGFFTPVMLYSDSDYYAANLAYLAILNLGILGIAFYKRWGSLNTIGFISTYLLFSIWFMNNYGPEDFWLTVLFLNVYYLIYSVSPYLNEFILGSKEKAAGTGLIMTNSFLAFGYNYYMISNFLQLEYVGIVCLLYAMTFFLMALHSYSSGLKNSAAFANFTANCALYLLIAVPVVFSSHWVTIFFSAQALVLLYLGRQLSLPGYVVSAHALLVFTLFQFFTYDYSEIFRLQPTDLCFTDGYMQQFGERFCTSGLLLFVLYQFAGFLRSFHHEDVQAGNPEQLYSGYSAFFTVFCLVLFAVLNIETSAWFHDFMSAGRVTAFSVVWSLYAAGLMLYGILQDVVILRRVSLAILMLTLIKVFLIDISHISTPFRILSFITLGLVLIVSSYLYTAFEKKIMPKMPWSET
ncbi:MAG: DUF2339 domain-containing protein [Candidatus Wallbacteria bacterium]|nr:DUF2339 domain-containing protein [Candidatus Wallbacteria bacterium]